MRFDSRICNAALLLLGLVGVLGIAVCSSESQPAETTQTTPAEQPVTPTPAPAVDAAVAPVAAPSPLDPQFGGAVQALGQYFVEVLSRPDGHLEAQVRDGQGQPVSPDTMAMAAEVQQDQGDPVPVVMLPSQDRYIGTVAGVQGRRPVNVSIRMPEAADPIATALFNELDLAPVQASLEPEHHGKVVVVGDTRMEIATSTKGQVHISVTDLQGAPIPPSAAALTKVQYLTPTGPQEVTLTPQGAMYIGRLAAAPPETFSVQLDLGFGSLTYRGIRLERFHPYAPTVTVQVPDKFTNQAQWAPNYTFVIVRPTPPRRGPHAAPPPPVVKIGTSAPPNVKVVIPPPPSVKVSVPAPPPPPSVKVSVPAPPPPPSVKVSVPAPPPPPSVKVKVSTPAPPPPPAVKVKVSAPPPPAPPAVKVKVSAPPPPAPPAVKVKVVAPGPPHHKGPAKNPPSGK